MESRLVFAHSSNSSYLAIMANKPLVILTDKQLWNVGIERKFMQKLASASNAPLIFVDDEKEEICAKYFKIDHDRYREIKQTYIKKDGTADLPIWEIALKSIQQTLVTKGNATVQNPGHSNLEGRQ